ncbi:MDR/zinc-dependent alcohol dehydrogenase-like family protein [Streptomonospora sediminis]
MSNTVPGLNVAAGTTVTFNPNVTPERSAGFAEFMYVQGTAETISECVIPLRDQSLSHIRWIPEPFACIVHAVDSSKLSTITPGDSVAIVGAGCSGALFAMYCGHLGAEVHVFNRGQERLDFLKRRNLISSSMLHSLSDVSEYRDQFDHVIIATTRIVRSVMDDAHLLCNPQGAILLYGGTQGGDEWLDTDIDIDPIRRRETRKYVQAHGKDYWLTGAYGCFTRDFNKAMKLVSDNGDRFRVADLTSREVQLSEFPGFLNEMARGADYPGKIMVTTRYGSKG